MNKEKFLKLADFIESIPDERFNMSHFMSKYDPVDTYDPINSNDYTSNLYLDIADCNTAGCIAGWALALENNGYAEVGFVNNQTMADSIAIRAGYYLGLNYDHASQLFFPDEQGSIWKRYLCRYYHILDDDSKHQVFLKYEDVDTKHYLEQYSYFANADVDLSSLRISNVCAAYVLRMIANGDFIFMDFTQYLINK